MISVTKSDRMYCISCHDREPLKAYDIRFGDPSVTNVSVMTVCGVCLMHLRKQIGEVNFSE